MADAALFGFQSPYCLEIVPDGDAIVTIANHNRSFRVHSLIVSNASLRLKELVNEARLRAHVDPFWANRPLTIKFGQDEPRAVELLFKLLHLRASASTPAPSLLLQLVVVAEKYACLNPPLLTNTLRDWMNIFRTDFNVLMSDDHWKLAQSAYIMKNVLLFEFWTRQLMLSHGNGSFNDLQAAKPPITNYNEFKLRLALGQKRDINRTDPNGRGSGLCLVCFNSAPQLFLSRPGCVCRSFRPGHHEM